MCMWSGCVEVAGLDVVWDSCGLISLDETLNKPTPRVVAACQPSEMWKNVK